jgi:hypothetical protein
LPKCLTHEDTSAWLRSSNIVLSYDITEEFQGVVKTDTRNVLVSLPSNPRQIAYFAMRIIEWLPTERTRLLWVSKWHIYPLLQKIFFETARRGCGCNDSLSLSPGHLFQPNKDADFDIEYSSGEHAALSGLLLLMMSFDWQGFVAADRCADQIVVGDESVFFCSNDPDRISSAVGLADQYKLNYLFDRAA